MSLGLLWGGGDDPCRGGLGPLVPPEWPVSDRIGRPGTEWHFLAVVSDHLLEQVAALDGFELKGDAAIFVSRTQHTDDAIERLRASIGICHDVLDALLLECLLAHFPPGANGVGQFEIGEVGMPALAGAEVAAFDLFLRGLPLLAEADDEEGCGVGGEFHDVSFRWSVVVGATPPIVVLHAAVAAVRAAFLGFGEERCDVVVAVASG